MQSDCQYSFEANGSNGTTEEESRKVKGCAVLKPGYFYFLVPFACVNLVFQSGFACNGISISPPVAGILAGLAGLTLYGLFRLASRFLSYTPKSDDLPIQADYMRRVNLNISQLDIDQNSAVTRRSKES
jgi:hypothetical protein